MPFYRSLHSPQFCACTQQKRPRLSISIVYFSRSTLTTSISSSRSLLWLAQATRSDLEARLQQREDEIERLKTQLEQGTVAESDPDKSPEQRRKAEDARLQACQASVGAHIQELSKFLTNNGLEQVNPTGQFCTRSLHTNAHPRWLKLRYE